MITDWKWNYQKGGEGYQYISENMLRSPITLESCSEVITFSFIYGTVENPIITHVVDITFQTIEDDYNGNLNEATTYVGYVEFLNFKKKVQDSVAYDMGEGSSENTINKG